MAVEDVDARDEPAFAAWYAVLDASAEHQRPGEPHWSVQEQREIALAGSPATRSTSAWDAETNTPPIAVNEALGFVENGRLPSWHRALDA